MANEVLVGLKIGAVVSGSLHAAFGSAKSTVQQLGRATDGLTTKQKLMGTELAASIARGGTGVERLRRQYDQVGRTIEQLKTKQERLNTSIARGETLKNKRGELRGQAMETIGTGVALGAPVVQSMRTAIDFQDQTRDIAITGGFDEAEEKRLSDVMRGAALRWNQTQTEVARGTGVLIAGGISSAKELAAYAPIMAKTATATRASMDDLGSVAIALNDNLGISAAGLERSMNILAYAGKRGQFELADMAKWLPQLTPQFAALGITGERAVAEIGASLQIARKGAGSNDEAANNYKNFLSKLTAPDTLKSFADAGIDLKTSMTNLISSGLTPTQAMLDIITKYMGTKSPKAASEFQKAMSLKDETERETALKRINEAYKLGELFRDMQVLSYLRPALANRAEQADIQKGGMGAADQGVTEQDWKKRMGSTKEELKRLGVNLADIGISVGSALIPALVDVTQVLVPLMASFSTWASENPGIIKGVVGLVGGLLAGKLAFIGLAYGANLVMSPFVAMSTTITTVSAKWTLLRGMWQMGKFAPLVSGLTRVGSGLLTVARYSGLFLRGVTMAFGAPLLIVARGALFLGKILGGTLLYGLQLAGQAVLSLGRALMMNPIGLLITGIALGAYLIYRYWEPIKGFFSGLWAEAKSGFNGGLSGIAGLILNFSPIGLFYRAFAGVLGYFGIELPGKFSEFGGLILGKLADGITNTAIWSEIRAGFSGGISGIGEQILNFSPLGLFYRAFAGVLGYFGVELPGKFSEFGGLILGKLADGITNTAIWSEIRVGFSGGISGIGELILNFSPLGLFYRAFSGVLGYFGIELPGKFSEFGGLILGKLADGITNTAIWSEIRTGFSGGILGIGELILNFSPLGLFYQAFAGVMSYFGIELPGKFSEFGGMLVSGLVNGISNMASSLKDSVVGIGSSVKGWFTETLGIQSPSRVFMGYGANISEGAALGITAQSDLVRKAALGMASKSEVDLSPAIPAELRPALPALKATNNPAPPNPADVPRASMMGGFAGAGQGAAPGAGAAPIFHFSPQINVPGGPGVREQVTQGLQAGYADFVKMMERYNHDKRRRSYGSPDEGFA